MKIIEMRSARILVQRLAWNLNTQQRHLKHKDAPPDDCPGWEYNYRFGSTSYLNQRHSDRAQIHSVIEALIKAVEAEPNRWHRAVLLGESGYTTSNGWIRVKIFGGYHEAPTLLGPYCKDKGVLPEFDKDEDGYYVLPFNMPEGASNVPHDDAKSTFGSDEKPAPRLETQPIDPETPIVVYDEWGMEVATTEVVL